MNIDIIKNGVGTGLLLQLAIGPVFVYIMHLVLQGGFLYGLMGVLAVTLVDFFYITLAMLGVAALLEYKRINIVLGILSSVVICVFGLLIFSSAFGVQTSVLQFYSASLLSSFVSVLIITLTSPLTIVFFSSIFTAKALEFGYRKKELYLFSFSVGLANRDFYGCFFDSLFFAGSWLPEFTLIVLNILVGVILVGYGIIRFIKVIKVVLHKAQPL